MNTIPDTSSLRDIPFYPVDQGLRDDVRRLGNLIGEILVEQRGEDFLALVELIRTRAILDREQERSSADLHQILTKMTPSTAEAVARAFTTYFNAVNMAERAHRIRRRRDYQREGTLPQPGGLQSVLQQLHDDGVDFDALCDQINTLCVDLVFTAHPTEAMRRALLEKEQDVMRGLIEDLDRQRTPQEQRATLERMRTALTASWQTAESPPSRPTVSDELAHVGFYLSEVLFRVLPVFYETFAEAMKTVYGEAPELPRVLQFSSWVGGDMDGNPNVGASTIADALATQRQTVLWAYRRDLSRLSRLLSQSPERIGIDPSIDARIAQYSKLFPAVLEGLRERNADMPYRTLLTLIETRLVATANQQAHAYSHPQEFIDDLQQIAHSLKENRGQHAGGFSLQRILWRARTFGFHLAALDIRQDATVHNEAIAQYLNDPAFVTATAEARGQRLVTCLEQTPPEREIDTLPEPARGTLSVFRTLAQARQQYGERALGPYIVSMSHSAADALAVLALAHLANEPETRDALDIAPLFETVADLEAAPQIVRALFSNPRYRTHVQGRGNRQMVMLGYSDSSKDAGIMASRFALQQAQIALLAVGKAFGVQIRFFHGRGGSISRGGGKTERAVMAAPRGSIAGYLRVTEQGEVIHRKYGIRALALRNIEQTCGAVLRTSLRPRPPEPREGLWRERAREMAAVSRDAYRALIHDDPDFPAYFRDATPIDLIERLRLGSRPAKRAGSGDIGALRAIPWVFSWAQTRCNLTAWYGTGTGLAHGIARFGLPALREMARDWPFFSALVDDLDMVLAKSDLSIFAGYSQLAGDRHTLFHPRIVQEFQRLHESLLAIHDSTELLPNDPRLRLSIRLRNPYLDPINLVQQSLLSRWRAAGRQEDADYRALVATVNGISAGLQNTG